MRRLRVARLRALSMDATSGAYSLAGFNANLTYARHLTMQAIRGVFQWAGFNINLTKQKYTATVTRGLYAMTGRTVELTYTPASTLGWAAGQPFPITLARGATFDLAQHIVGDVNDVSTITANVTLPSGVTISGPPWRLNASSAATLGTTSNVNLTLVEAQTGDWATRISGPGVVWYHNFDAAAEVNQFRWTNGFGGGNDPNGAGVNGNHVTWVSSGGADGGAFMRLTYPVGQSAGGSSWWRPFNPLTGATNGRGVADPGANGTLTPASFTVTSGSSTLSEWSSSQTNSGWYGHATHVAANPTRFQGNDFYYQVRVRRAQTPGAPPDSQQFSNITGKLCWLTTTVFSNPAQEVVTYGNSAGNGDQVGVQPRHRMYIGQNFNPIESQPGATVTLNNNTINWRYSGGWDTLLYHVTPGTNGGTGSNRTRIEVWAQHDLTLNPSEAGQYTKIWDVLYPQSFETGSNSSGAPSFIGWNALLLAIYHNGAVFTTTTFNFDYDQVIFSKNTIPAPTA